MSRTQEILEILKFNQMALADIDSSEAQVRDGMPKSPGPLN